MRTYISKQTSLAFAIIAALVMTSCSDNDKWSPGAADPEGVMGVFFDSDNTTEISIDDSTSFVLRITRLDSSEAATVRIVKDSVNEQLIKVPDSVVFEKGEASTTLTIDASNMENAEEKSTTFRISIDPAQVSQYAAGLNTIDVSVGKLWSVLVSKARFYWANKTDLPSWYSDIEQYLDENRFRIKDFLGSGEDWEFRIQSADESLYYGSYTNLSGDVTTWMGSVDVEFDEYHAYNYDGDMIYFMPDMANSVYGWKTPGYELGYASFCVWNGYTYIDFSQNYLSTWAYGYGDDDQTDVGGYFYGYWTADQVMK